jgi:hypothetical protein
MKVKKLNKVYAVASNCNGVVVASGCSTCCFACCCS